MVLYGPDHVVGRVLDPSTSLVFSRSDNTWQVSVWWPDTRRRQRLSLGLIDEAEARAAYGRWLAEVLPVLVAQHEAPVEEPPAGPAGPRIRGLIDWYLDTHLPYLGRAPKTIAHYRRVLDDFAVYCAQRHIGRTGQIGTRVVQEWQLWLRDFRRQPNAPNARRDELLALRRWLEEAHEAGELPDLPRISWRIPGRGKGSRFRALSAEQLGRFLSTLQEKEPDLYPVTAWLALSGWRVGDVLDLRWGEVKEGWIDREQLKTRAKLLYPVTIPLHRLLDEARAGRKVHKADHVFLDRAGRPVEYQTYKKALEYWCRTRWNQNISPRDLRKTFASIMAGAGCPPNVLKELLGHQDVTMTLVYYVDVDQDRMLEWGQRFWADLVKTTENPHSPDTENPAS